MAKISLVLPFALPVPEFAPDLTRALQAPALAALLSRTSARRRVPADDAVRALPHEQWLARALGLSPDGRPTFAAAAMRGYGLDPDAGSWFIVNPTHIQIATSHLMMADPRQLRLSGEDSRALFETARPSFEEAGYTLAYGDAGTWFVRADDWAELDTATPDAAAGMDLTDWMPTGPRAVAYRRLQNEVQMMWFGHPANAAREARGLAAVNGLWVWGGAPAASLPAAPRPLVACDVPGWLAAMASRVAATPAELPGGLEGDAILVCGSLAPAALAVDWAGWLHEMQRLETELFAPLLAALKAGGVRSIELVLSHRDAHAESTTTALAQRKFWRRPTLEALL